MANMLECRLVITGAPDEVLECLVSIASPASESEDARLFDFNRVIPVAADERVTPWETKRNARGVTVRHPLEGGGARVEFYTAWAPPRPVIEALADRFPNLGFDLAYFDQSAPVAGRLRRAPGEEMWATIDATHDYGFCNAA